MCPKHGTRTEFQLEILTTSTISAIHTFRENIVESSRNVSETTKWSITCIFPFIKLLCGNVWHIFWNISNFVLLLICIILFILIQYKIWNYMNKTLHILLCVLMCVSLQKSVLVFACMFSYILSLHRSNALAHISNRTPILICLKLYLIWFQVPTFPFVYGTISSTTEYTLNPHQRSILR